MSLQVNFTTHGHQLKAAYEDILRPVNSQGANNWALFGYDKGTNDLKVLGQGSGGLEELEEEFADGKIQYAFVRLVDPYSQLNKFVLIAWCGDGVPESKKGLFNSHLADVSNFLKGYHLQINARNEADVTPAQIMKRLDEGSGSKYSIHKETYEAERIRPLQSAYKKTEIPDIAAMQRNPTKPEPAPKVNVGSKPYGYSSSASSAAAPAKLEDRVWPPPSSTSSSTSASNATPPTSTERSWKTSGAGSYVSSTPSFNKVAPPASLSSYGGGAQSRPEPTVNKAHQIRLEREAREKEERERIKREIEASEARQRFASSGASGPTSTAQRLAEERKLQAQKEAEREAEQQQAASRGGAGFNNSPSGLSSSPNRIREERLAHEKEERERAQAEDSARAAREAFKAREESSLREQTNVREDELRRQKEHEQRQQREARESEERHAQEQSNLQRQRQQEEEEREEAAAAARQRQQEDEEEERRLQQQRQQRQKDEDEAKQRHQREQQEADDRKHRQAEEDAAKERQRRQAEEEEEADRERQLQEEVNAAAAKSVNLGADALLASTEHPELNVSGSVSAIVLYSYEKSEENEMSLIEGEIILNVTELDVGWWSGESEDGTRSGLFPANYVEVIEHAQQQEQHHDAHDDHHTAAAAAVHDHHQGHEVEHDTYATPQHAHDAGAAPAGGAEKPSAVALYDYQAGEPNEVSFNEGEAITEIDFVTEDWWSGKSEAGATGLFPAMATTTTARPFDIPELRHQLSRFVTTRTACSCARVSKAWAATFTPAIWFEVDFAVHPRFVTLSRSIISKNGHFIRKVKNAKTFNQVSTLTNPSIQYLRRLEVETTASVLQHEYAYEVWVPAGS
ncbi:hypothetical protein BGW39_006775 [Mortierella sp. 14UC]|nr:hypothetical protein BGW39_006775 [Mortierella sp. 14UC]